MIKKRAYIVIALFILAGCATTSTEREVRLLTAAITAPNTFTARFSGLEENLESYQFSVSPETKIIDLSRDGNNLVFTLENDFTEGTSYNFSFVNDEKGLEGAIDIKSDDLQDYLFNQMYSSKPLGMNRENGAFVFRLFAPRESAVSLLIFDQYDQVEGLSYEMQKDEEGVFEVSIDDDLWNKYYGYRIEIRDYPAPVLSPQLPPSTVFADPYSVALATSNTYPQKGRTLIKDFSDFDWQGDTFTGMPLAEAIILETHIRDLTADSSAGTDYPGTYTGVVDAQVGGMTYLEKLGINAVEFLPLQEFCNVEPPFGKTTLGVANTYNAYAQNYWGYMTTNFFAPESYYATDGNLNPESWNGTDGRAVNEMKTMVRELHKKGISVILDVVYNHVSDYDENPLKLIDYDFYFKEVENTGCGNEVETRRLMARRLVLDSVRYWMEEYHVDGFRFDLAASHDPETIQAVYTMAKAINPEVMLIAEPWGGEGATNSDQFIDIGWAKWNSAFRDVVRSQNRPLSEGEALALGNNNGASGLIPFWAGELRGDSSQYVNYIESHDDATFSDIMRILSGFYAYRDEAGNINRIENRQDYLELPENLIQANKLAATTLFLSQGTPMLHLGQEWGRGKLTPNLEGMVPEVTDNGRLGSSSDNVVYQTPTPNSYNADNATNYINYNEIVLNQDLWDYYQGLIRLRLSDPLLGRSDLDQVKIIESSQPNSLALSIAEVYYGFINADPVESAVYEIPQGTYDLLVNGDDAGTDSLTVLKTSELVVPPATAMVLKVTD